MFLDIQELRDSYNHERLDKTDCVNVVSKKKKKKKKAFF